MHNRLIFSQVEEKTGPVMQPLVMQLASQITYVTALTLVSWIAIQQLHIVR